MTKNLYKTKYDNLVIKIDLELEKLKSLIEEKGL
jgi:hypothetical protein